MLQGSSFPQIFHCTTGAYHAGKRALI